jgi:hypothetical protein
MTDAPARGPRTLVPAGRPPMLAPAGRPPMLAPAVTRPEERGRQADKSQGGGRHARPGGPLRGLTRRPLAVVLLCAGLLVAVGGTAGLLLMGGRPGVSPRPLAHPGRAPAGAVAALPGPLAAPPGQPALPRGPLAAPPVQAAAAAVSRPVYLTIPAIGVHTRLVRLGLTAQGTLQVPGSTSVAGWYTGGPRPGQVGPAVIAGHIDSYRGPGVFFRLRLLRAGDRVYVRRADGTLTVFRVYAAYSYAKDRFPTRRVYGPAPGPELRLITCGGTFDPATGSYLRNVVVYAAQAR